MSQRRSNKKSRNGKTRAVARVGPQYARDFERKASGHAPERLHRIVCTSSAFVQGVPGNRMTYAANSGGVTSTGEFAAIAAQGTYRMFRILAIRLRVQAMFQQPAATAATLSYGPLIGCVGAGTVPPPTTVAGVLQSQGYQIARMPQNFIDMVVDAGVNPNAKLWSNVLPAGSVVANENQMWITILSTGVYPAGWASAVDQLFLSFEFDVEFRTA